MAEKKTKSQAERVAAANKKSKPSGAKTNSAKKTVGKTPEKAPEQQMQIPVRVITSGVCLVLFVLFLIVFLWPDNGWLMPFFRRFVLGLIGKTGFYVSIPGLLYLFCIQAFSGKRPIKLRSICMISFILLCGSISQLALDGSSLPSGFSLLAHLYEGGAEGTTAGLVCGGIALLVGSASEPLAWIIFIVAALRTLLAAFQITIPSIIRAVQNRHQTHRVCGTEAPEKSGTGGDRYSCG